jgi:hypothetical protein
MKKILTVLFIATLASCSNDANELNEMQNTTVLQKSDQVAPEVEYEAILSNLYPSYSVGDWTELVDEDGNITLVKEVENSDNTMAYLIQDPTTGHYLFAAKNEVAKTIYVRDFTADILIDGSYEGVLPVAIDIHHPNAGTITIGWFRRFTRRFIGPGRSNGDWGSCFNGAQYRTVIYTFSVLFMEFENGSEVQSREC